MTQQDDQKSWQQDEPSPTAKNTGSKSLGNLESLVDELLKEAPDTQRVQEMMQGLGLPYKDDPIYQLNTVLQALHSPMDKEEGPDANL